MVRSWNQVKEADWKAVKFGAWLTAMLHRQKRMPSLRQVLSDGRGPEYTEEDLAKAREFHRELLKRKGLADASA